MTVLGWHMRAFRMAFNGIWRRFTWWMTSENAGKWQKKAGNGWKWLKMALSFSASAVTRHVMMFDCVLDGKWQIWTALFVGRGGTNIYIQSKRLSILLFCFWYYGTIKVQENLNFIFFHPPTSSMEGKIISFLGQ